MEEAVRLTDIQERWGSVLTVSHAKRKLRPWSTGILENDNKVDLA